MDIVLLEKIEGCGNIGDVVKVKNGFARNYLFPLKKALRATKENIAYFESQKEEIEKRNKDIVSMASNLAKQVDGLSLTVIRGAGDSGHLYGSVSSKDIATMLSDRGIKIDSKCIRIDNPIKEIGIYNLKIVLHADVKANIMINVARTEDEASNAIKKLETKKSDNKDDIKTDDQIKSEIISSESNDIVNDNI